MTLKYDADTKAQVIAEWRAGSSLNQLAAQHGVPKSTVRLWVAGYERINFPVPPADRMKAYDLDGMALELVSGSVNACMSIYNITQDRSWLQEQSAGGLAILVGVISDKLYRLLGVINENRLLSEQAEQSE